MTLPIIMHTTFLAAKHGIFTHGLESYTPTKTDTIYNWRSVRSFVTYGAPPYNSAALDLLKLFLIFAHTYLKFIYSEKVTKFCEIFTVDLSYIVTVKSTVEIL